MSLTHTCYLKPLSNLKRLCARRWNPKSGLKRSSQPSRVAMTLIELLVTIAIIGILTSVVAGGMAAATNTAKSAKTKSIIAKIHTLLNPVYQDYKNRRVQIKEADAQGSVLRATLRLQALRELIKLEMPDRWSDIYLGDLKGTNLVSLAKRSSVSQLYRRKYNQLRNGASLAELQENESAECLYLIVMTLADDGEAATHFSDSDIGDTDEDGAFEFLDGYGQPIRFIRWPVGFTEASSLMSGNAKKDHDPFDLFLLEPGAFRLVPLIYSVGIDGESGLVEKYPSGFNPFWVDPYGKNISNPLERLGDSRLVEGEQVHLDNVHNHHLDGTK